MVAKALEVLLILHADHEQNCSTSSVRLVGSSMCNLFASISAAIYALWGPLHGGANQAVIEMLQKIFDDGGAWGPVGSSETLRNPLKITYSRCFRSFA